MPAGRPTKYKPEYCQQLIDFMEDGRSLTGFAASLSVSKQTLYDWMKANPEFLDAFNVAQEKCQYWWEETGRKGLFMGGKDNPFQTNLYNFTMAARFGWSTKQETKQEASVTLMVDQEDCEL